MAANKTPIATDSAEELRGLVGDDASATFESNPNFVRSNPTESASSDHLALRGTDDTADSEEEDEEADEDDELDDDELDEDEDIDEDEEEEDEDDEDEDDEDEDDDDPDDEDEDDDADEVLQAAEPVDVHGPGKHSREDIEEELEEMEEEEGDEEGVESPEEEDEESQHAQRAIDEALRMSAIEIAGQGY